MQIPTSLIRDERPVSEDSEAGLVIADVVSDDIESHLESKRKRLLWSVGIGILTLGIGVYALWIGQGFVGAVGLGVAVATFGFGVYTYQDTPDVEVKRAEKRFWTLHLLPQSDEVMLVDATKSVPEIDFELEMIRNQERLRDVSTTLQQSWNLPIILPRDENPESALQKHFSELEAVLSDTEQTSIQLPVLGREAGATSAVTTIAPRAQSGTRDIPAEIPIEEAKTEVNELETLETLAFEDDVEEMFDEVRTHSTETLDRLTETQEEMVEVLNDSIESVGDSLTMLSYNFYCPTCLDDDIYTELNLQEKNDEIQWSCETCRNSHEVEQAVPINRLKDELVDEIWDRLWIEKDDEKRGIYEDIEDQQAELKEREFERKQEIIQDGWNRIKDIRSKIRDLETEAVAGKGAVEEIGDVMVKYERLREERKAEFQEDVASAIEQVDEETERVLQETRDFEQEQTRAAEKEAEQRAEIRREEEERRHRELRAAQDGGLGIAGSLASRVRKQKIAIKCRRIDETEAGEGWGETDLRQGLVVETHRPVAVNETMILLRARATGLTDTDEVAAYFEWRDAEDGGGILSGDSWTATEEQVLTEPGRFSVEMTDVDPDARYEIRAVVAADGKQHGETLLYPDDATVDVSPDMETIKAELPDDIRGDQS